MFGRHIIKVIYSNKSSKVAKPIDFHSHSPMHEIYIRRESMAIVKNALIEH